MNKSIICTEKGAVCKGKERRGAGAVRFCPEDGCRYKRAMERLKEENALEWVGRLNNIRACAREIVNEEIIYV